MACFSILVSLLEFFFAFFSVPVCGYCSGFLLIFFFLLSGIFSGILLFGAPARRRRFETVFSGVICISVIPVFEIPGRGKKFYGEFQSYLKFSEKFLKNFVG